VVWVVAGTLLQALTQQRGMHGKAGRDDGSLHCHTLDGLRV
jgi:hypothetical protein